MPEQQVLSGLCAFYVLPGLGGTMLFMHYVNVFSAARLQLNFRVKLPTGTRVPFPTIIRR